MPDPDPEPSAPLTPVGPLAPGSVSLRLYPHNELPATEIVDRLCTMAARAADVGFDGVMTSEHHGGFAGYLRRLAAEVPALQPGDLRSLEPAPLPEG